MVPIEKRRDTARRNREKVVESAIALFQEKGFDNVSIDEIGKAAGLSRGTLYKLFVSKEDIVATYMAQWNALYARFYHEELEHADMGALEKFRALVTYMITASTQGGQALQRVAIASGMRDGLLAEKVAVNSQEIDQILRGILTDGVENGTITRRYPVEDMLRMACILVEGIPLRWAGQYDGSSVEEAIGSAIDMLMDLFRNTETERSIPK